MKRILSALLLSLTLFLAPLGVLAAPLTFSPDIDYQAEVAAWGCTATVFVIPYAKLNGFYDSGQHRIFLIGFENLPLNWQRLILAHETGHCLQAQNNEFEALYARGPYEREWDADAFAIRAVAERWGLDGAALNQEVWGTLYGQYGFEGFENSPHGLSTHRQTRGLLNRWIYPVEGA